MILKLNSLNKSFHTQDKKTIQILKDVDFEILVAGSYAILGKSGSGKTTLLSLIGGLDRPDSGDISIENTSITKLSEKELTRFRASQMSIVFQQYHLIESLTALENIMLPLEIQKANVSIEVGLKILAQVGLADRANHLPKQLSGGEKQRVAIARALVVNPKILLADEPSGNLDEETGSQVMGLLMDLVKEFDTTLILVTHDKDLAKKCDRVFTLESHKLVEANL